MSASGSIDTNIRVLMDSQDRHDISTTLTILLSMLNAQDSRQSVEQSLQPQVLINLLRKFSNEDSEDAVVITRTCDVLRELLRSAAWTEIQSQYLELMITGSKSFASPVKILIIDQFFKALQNDSSLKLLLNSSHLFPDFLLDSITDESSSVAEKASEFIKEMSKFEIGREVLCKSEIVNSFTDLAMKASLIIKCRIYDCIIKVATYSQDVMAAYDGLLLEIVNDLDGDDIMAPLNALESFNKIARFTIGEDFLVRNEVLKRVSNMLDKLALEEDQLRKVLLEGACFKFFGLFTIKRPEILPELNSEYRLFEHLSRALSDCNLDVSQSAVETIGMIGSHAEGLRFLNLNCESLLKQLLNLYNSTYGESKTPIMRALSSMIAQTEDSEEMEITTKLIYDLIISSTTPLDDFINISKNSFIDVRMAGVSLLRAMAHRKWGLWAFAAHPSFFSKYLFDRGTESSHEGKVAKYELVCTILEFLKKYDISNYDDKTLEMLTKYAKEGPFSTTLGTHVATEEA